jgi:hypothetical protein
MLFGLDFLGIARYKSIASKNFPKGWAVGCFSNTFGDSRPAIEQLLKSKKASAVRVHLLWDDAHKFNNKDVARATSEIKKWIPLIEAYPSIKWYFSAACEHRANANLAGKLAQSILTNTPEFVTCVNTPIDNGADLFGDRIINERHGANAKPRSVTDQFSFDGSACVDSDVTTIKNTWRNTPNIFFFWEPRFNGRWETSDTTPRPERTARPDDGLIKSVHFLSNTKGKTSLPKGVIYKSHAENKGNGDPRAEKPLFIIPHKTSTIVLKALNGEILTKFRYYGPFNGGGYRYYTGRPGYMLAKIAMTKTGNYLCEAWVNGKKYATINPGFRDGVFRT